MAVEGVDEAVAARHARPARHRAEVRGCRFGSVSYAVACATAIGQSKMHASREPGARSREQLLRSLTTAETRHHSRHFSDIAPDLPHALTASFAASLPHRIDACPLSSRATHAPASLPSAQRRRPPDSHDHRQDLGPSSWDLPSQPASQPASGSAAVAERDRRHDNTSCLCSYPWNSSPYPLSTSPRPSLSRIGPSSH